MRISVSPTVLASRTPRATLPVGRRVGQREQLVLKPVHLLPGDRAASAGRRGRAVALRLVADRLELGLAPRPVPSSPSRSSRRSAGSGAVSGPSVQEHLRVVVVQPAAAHLVPQAGAAGRCCGRCRPGRNSRSSGSGRTCGRGSGRSSPSGPGPTRLTVSICSSTLSMMNRTLNRWLTSLTPSARKPVAISVLVPLRVASWPAAGRRRSARG